MTQHAISLDSINAAVSMAGYLVCFFCIMQLTVAGSMQSSEKLLILKVFVWQIIYETAKITTMILEGRKGGVIHNLLLVSNFFEFASVAFLTGAVSGMIMHYLAADAADELLSKVCRACMYIQLALITVNLFTGFIYTVGDDNIYRRGRLYPLAFVLPFVMLLICFALRIKNKDRLSKKQYAFFDAAFASVTAGGAIYAFAPGFNAGELAAIIATALLYVLMVEKQNALYEARMEESLTMRARLLAGQIEPHFISNSLTMIRTLCEPGSESYEAITDLAGFMRGSLRAMTEAGPIPVAEELGIVEQYIDLQNRRFGRSITTEWHIEDEAFRVPAFCVQIPVENAFKHGFGDTEGGRWKIDICTYETKDCHVLSVSDNGLGFDTSQDSCGTGLKNVRTRVRRMCGGSVDIISAPGKGTKVIISIPKEEGAEGEFSYSRRREGGERRP